MQVYPAAPTVKSAMVINNVLLPWLSGCRSQWKSLPVGSWLLRRRAASINACTWRYCASDSKVGDTRTGRCTHSFSDLDVQYSESNIYARAKSGAIYVLPSLKSKQDQAAHRHLPKALQSSNSSWISWMAGGGKIINGDGHAYAVPMNSDILKSGER
jgi:hypothetical protein